VAGRKVGKKCVAPSRKNRRRHHCTRTVTAGKLTFAGHAGTNKVFFDGVISKHAKLKPGSYSLHLTASAAGGHSATSTLHFTIVR
jgi:hypothetical protein